MNAMPERERLNISITKKDNYANGEGNYDNGGGNNENGGG